MKNYTLKNGIFIFENQEDAVSFWNKIAGESKGCLIEGNIFMVIHNSWLRKLLMWLFRN